MRKYILISLAIFLIGGSFILFRYAKRISNLSGKDINSEYVLNTLSSMTEGAVLPKGEWSYGIDISHHQPFVNWKKLRVYLDKNNRTVWNENEAVKEIKLDYVIMKATEGGDFKDWRFKSRWRKAERAGYMRGAYHFLRPEKDAGEQAKNFIDQVGEIKAEDFPPILDIEQMDGTNPYVVTTKALEWLKIVENHYGRRPIVYANPYYLKVILYPEITENYPIWVANYGAARPSWNRWHIWQFTDRALVRGVGAVDLNVKKVN